MRSSLMVGLAFLAAFTALPAFAEEAITLGIGMQRILNIPGISRISVPDSSVATARTVGGNQVLIFGNGEGKGSLIVWQNSGKVLRYTLTVRKVDPAEIVNEIKKMLGDMEGVSVRPVGDRIVFDGQAYNQADVDRIEQVVAAYAYANVVNFVKTSPNAKKLMAQNLNAAFQKAGLKNVVANVVGATIFLEGSVESQQDLQKAESITKALGEKPDNLLVVGIKRMVLSEVQFVEIRRQSLDRFGIKYPTDITGSARAVFDVSKELFSSNAATGGLTGQLSASSNLSLGFQMNDGYARLLAQPKLVCASGEKAEFLAGGEVPIPLITANQFAVEYKPYGVILRLQPTADRNGNIQTEIEAEVSEVDTSVAVVTNGISVPGFRSRKVKTNVTVRHGETIVLSGVFAHDEQKQVSKLPGLGHIPIIGEFFKNRAFDSNKRELVIFVTPRLVNPESERIRNIIDEVKGRYKQAKGEVNFGIFD